MEQSSKKWYKNEITDKVWWLDNSTEEKGAFIFSFDMQQEFNLFADYPHALTAEQKAIFDKENPYWVEFFADRQ